MDIVHQCLALAPVPYLAPAFSVLRFIWSSIEQAQASKRQLEALAQTIAQLLSTLNTECRAGRLLQVKMSTPLTNLDRFILFTMPQRFVSNRRSPHRLLDEISTFIQKETSRPFLQVIFSKDRRVSQIEEYHRRIATAVTSFQVSCYMCDSLVN